MSANIEYGASSGEVTASIKQLFEDASAAGAVDIRVSTFGVDGSKPLAGLIQSADASPKNYQGLLDALSKLAENVSSEKWASFDSSFKSYGETLLDVALGPTIEELKTEAILNRLESVTEDLRHLRGMRKQVAQLPDPEFESDGGSSVDGMWFDYPGFGDEPEFNRFQRVIPRWKERLIGGAIIVRGVEREALLYAAQRCLGQKHSNDGATFDLKSVASTYALLADNGGKLVNFYAAYVKQNGELDDDEGAAFDFPCSPSTGKEIRFCVTSPNRRPTVQVTLPEGVCEVPEIGRRDAYETGLPFRAYRMGDAPEVRWRVKRPIATAFNGQTSLNLSPRSAGTYIKQQLDNLGYSKDVDFDGSVVLDVYVGWPTLYPEAPANDDVLELSQFLRIPSTKIFECGTETIGPGVNMRRMTASFMSDEVKYENSSCTVLLAWVRWDAGKEPQFSGILSALDDFFWDDFKGGAAITSVVARTRAGAEFRAPLVSYGVTFVEDEKQKNLTHRYMSKDWLEGRTAISWGELGD
ncbi:MAG TPA: hypothetical protein VGO52_20255 [Hyphomonadaceae bacterium]|nr:hypothetical protein [Hyphomonadaceae bacterium]